MTDGEFLQLCSTLDRHIASRVERLIIELKTERKAHAKTRLALDNARTQLGLALDAEKEAHAKTKDALRDWQLGKGDTEMEAENKRLHAEIANQAHEWMLAIRDIVELRQRAKRAETALAKASDEYAQIAELLFDESEYEQDVHRRLATILNELAAENERWAKLLQRIKTALIRHVSGHAPMRIPADTHSDSDILLSDIEALETKEEKK